MVVTCRALQVICVLFYDVIQHLHAPLLAVRRNPLCKDKQFRTKHKLFDAISQTIISWWVVAMVTMFKVVTMVIMVKMKNGMCHFPHYNINRNLFIFIL